MKPNNVQDTNSFVDKVSIVDWKGYAERLDNLPISKACVLLELFCSYLDKANVPAEDFPLTCLASYKYGSEEYPLLRQTVALTAIAKLATKKTSNWSSRFSDTLVEYWLGIFKWLSFFCSISSEGKGMSEKDIQAVTNVLEGVLYPILLDDRFATVISSTAGIVKVAAILWLREDPASLRRTEDICALMLCRMLSPYKPAALNEVLEGAGGPDSVARVIVSRLRLSFSCQPIDSLRVAVCFNLLHELTIQVVRAEMCGPGKSHPLGVAMSAADSLSIVTEALVVLSRLSSKRNKETVSAIRCGFAYLSDNMEYHGEVSIVKSVQNGLLDAFVNCSPMFCQLSLRDRGVVEKIINNILPRYLVYPSAIRAIKPYITNLRGTDVDRKISNSVVRKAWYAFHIYALQRIYIREAQKSRRSIPCTNCSKLARANCLKRCDKCHIILYCSRECQMEDWRIHKGECRKAQYELLETGYSPLSQAEEALIYTIIKRDLVCKLPLLHVWASQEYPRTPLSEMAIAADYDTVPAAFDIFPLHNLPDMIRGKIDPAEVPTDEELNILREQEATVIVITLSHGMNIRRKILPLSVSLWDALPELRLGMIDRSVESLSLDDLNFLARYCVGIPVPSKREMKKPKLHRLMGEMVKEEVRRRGDIQGTWLTATKRYNREALREANTFYNACT